MGQCFLHQELQWDPDKAQQSSARQGKSVIVYGHSKVGTQSVGCFPGNGWKTCDWQLRECRTKHEPITTELSGNRESHLFATPDLSHGYLKKYFHLCSSKSFAYELVPQSGSKKAGHCIPGESQRWPEVGMKAEGFTELLLKWGIGVELKAECDWRAHLGQITEKYQTQQWKRKTKMDPRLNVKILDRKAGLQMQPCSLLPEWNVCWVWWKEGKSQRRIPDGVFSDICWKCLSLQGIGGISLEQDTQGNEFQANLYLHVLFLQLWKCNP